MKRTSIFERICAAATGVGMLVALAVVPAGPIASRVLADHKPNHGGEGGGGGGGGNGGGDTQDMPVRATLSDMPIYNVRSDDSGDYADSNKNHITAHIGRSAGQFRLITNTNLSSGGRTMRFFFSPGTVTSVLGDVGTDVWEQGFSPIGVDIRTARPQVTEADGYVDLRALAPNESKPIAVAISLQKDNTSGVQLAYGDVLWPHDDPNSTLPIGGSLATVVGGADNDGDGFSDSWTISGSNSWVEDIGEELAMAFQITIEKQ